MLQASTFPVSHGKYAFLKVLSSDGDGPVYLAALSGQKRPWVIKTLPLHGPGAVLIEALESDAQLLSRMQSAALVSVLASTDVERDGGFVMEYVAGKSLAAIRRRAQDYSLLLPTELGLVIAHDVFAAVQLFHGFEGGLRVHGNISPRTILVAYSGDAKLAGYRPGVPSRSGVEAHLANDLRPMAGILYDLPFEMFPKELAHLVPRLLEDDLSPGEAVAAVRAFLGDYKPSAEQRRKVAAWLADLFLGQREEDAREEARLLASGTQLLATAPAGPGMGLVYVGGATAVLGLLSGALLLSPRRVDRGHLPTVHASVPLVRAEPAQDPPPGTPAQTFEMPLQESPSSTPVVGNPVVPTQVTAPSGDSAAVARDSTGPLPASTDSPAAKRLPSRRAAAESTADRLLRMADAAFGAGKRIEAINLGLQAVEAGGGVRAHLVLGEYYRSMHRYHEAINHYRAAIEIEPDNKLASTGVRLLEKRVAPCQ